MGGTKKMKALYCINYLDTCIFLFDIFRSLGKKSKNNLVQMGTIKFASEIY